MKIKGVYIKNMDRDVFLSLGKLAAVFIQCHVGCRSRIITMGQSPYGDLNDIIQLAQDVIFDSKSLISYDQDGATFKGKMVYILGVGCLFYPNDAMAVFF